MPANKTQPTAASVDDYLAAIANDGRRADCRALSALITKATGLPAEMWGTAIVGFGRYRYRYDSGREGDACLVGFASRKADITVYLSEAALAQPERLARLGRHKTGRGCLYVKRLADVDLAVMTDLVTAAVAEQRARHG